MFLMPISPGNRRFRAFSSEENLISPDAAANAPISVVLVIGTPSVLSAIDVASIVISFTPSGTLKSGAFSVLTITMPPYDIIRLVDLAPFPDCFVIEPYECLHRCPAALDAECGKCLCIDAAFKSGHRYQFGGSNGALPAPAVDTQFSQEKSPVILHDESL